jgi:hypothetical protein
MKSSFEVVWARIEASQGQTFRQLRGGEFTYEVESGCVAPDRTNRLIPRAHFERAWEMAPLENTVPLQSLQGPSYLFAILMDSRINAGEW